jgi:CheY-like chemotaxis protein
MVRDYLASPDFLQTRSRFPLISFHTSLNPNLSNISCSPIHIRKCLMNLITNGVEAIQGKGTVTIVTANHFQGEAAPYSTQILPEGNYVKITVGDSGSGIAPHEIDHIFEPFFTKKVMGRSGTGLGLAVVWNTMRDHGGVVSVVSDRHGTTFELFFPAVADRVVEAAMQDWQAWKGNRERVLVIDDEARQREIASQLLTLLNYSVATMPSGEKAVEYLRKHSADILILDMIMAPGQNGRATYEQILKIHPGQKAVIASVHIRSQALHFGTNRFRHIQNPPLMIKSTKL